MARQTTEISTGEKVWQYDPWQSKNGVVPIHYWLAFIAIAAGRDGNNTLKRQVIEEALRVSRSEANKAHYRGWLEQLSEAPEPPCPQTVH